jgi:hypothetical protein
VQGMTVMSKLKPIRKLPALFAAVNASATLSGCQLSEPKLSTNPSRPFDDAKAMSGVQIRIKDVRTSQ